MALYKVTIDLEKILLLKRNQILYNPLGGTEYSYEYGMMNTQERRGGARQEIK